MKLSGLVAAVALVSTVSIASAEPEKTIDFNFDITITQASKLAGTETYCEVSAYVTSAPTYNEFAASKAQGSKCVVKLPVRWVKKDLPATINFNVEVIARETSEPYIALRSHRSSINNVTIPAGDNKTVKSTYKLRF